eukprot:5286609-Prymnesium_polylepis.1
MGPDQDPRDVKRGAGRRLIQRSRAGITPLEGRHCALALHSTGDGVTPHRRAFIRVTELYVIRRCAAGPTQVSAGWRLS